MLFNSYEFIFLFLLPLLFLYRVVPFSVGVWLLIWASVVFYGVWSLAHLALLMASLVVNYIIVKKITHAKGSAKWLLLLSIVLNLVPLVYFKYAYFLHLSSEQPLLPLAISFYTFQQIALSVDVYRKKVQFKGLREYLFFVLFFPQLVAGPIVHYGELVPQLKSNRGFTLAKFNTGLLLFSLGLFKKVVLADTLSPIAQQGFTLTQNLQTPQAWQGLFAYGFEIYFDFSGYSDMALGLALMFGFFLPVNFFSPYKAHSVIEFWRRWHITLSRFLRDYVYIPLGGSRVGSARLAFNLSITMLLGGIWHGAGWGFIVWGMMHGVLLSIAHFWKWQVPKLLGILLTFLSVMLLWVSFRLQSLEEITHFYALLFDVSAWSLPVWSDRANLLVAAAFFVVWFLPNSLEFSRYDTPKMLQLTKRHAFVGAVALFVALKLMAEMPSMSFVYFNF